ncbi:hypothetical protein ACFSTC_26295 [Nonomuraea ferruginea]
MSGTRGGGTGGLRVALTMRNGPVRRRKTGSASANSGSSRSAEVTPGSGRSRKPPSWGAQVAPHRLLPVVGVGVLGGGEGALPVEEGLGLLGGHRRGRRLGLLG